MPESCTTRRWTPKLSATAWMASSPGVNVWMRSGTTRRSSRIATFGLSTMCDTIWSSSLRVTGAPGCWGASHALRTLRMARAVPPMHEAHSALCSPSALRTRLEIASRMSLASRALGRRPSTYFSKRESEPMGTLVASFAWPSSKTSTSLEPPPTSICTPEAAPECHMAPAKPRRASSTPLKSSTCTPHSSSTLLRTSWQLEELRMAAVAKQERRSSSVNRDAALRYSLSVLMSASTPASSSLPLCGSMWLASPS